MCIHPEKQDVLEHFHQSLKSTYCLDFQKDWDDGVYLHLFATEDDVQECLDFSPSGVQPYCLCSIEAFTGEVVR